MKKLGVFKRKAFEFHPFLQFGVKPIASQGNIPKKVVHPVCIFFLLPQFRIYKILQGSFMGCPVIRKNRLAPF